MSWNDAPTTADYANHAASNAKEAAEGARFIALCAYASARGAYSADMAADVAQGAESVARAAWNTEHYGTPMFGQCPTINILRAIDKVLAKGN